METETKKGKVTRMGGYNDEFGAVGIQLNGDAWVNVYGSLEEVNTKLMGFDVGDFVTATLKKGTKSVVEIKKSEESYTQASVLHDESRVEKLVRCIRDAEQAWKLAEFPEITPEMIQKTAITFYLEEKRR